MFSAVLTYSWELEIPVTNTEVTERSQYWESPELRYRESTAHTHSICCPYSSAPELHLLVSPRTVPFVLSQTCPLSSLRLTPSLVQTWKIVGRVGSYGLWTDSVGIFSLGVWD